MLIAMERNHLLKALSHIQRVVEKRNTYPILANVLLRTGEGTIEMRATDLDIEITESVPANVLAQGSTTVSAHKIYEIVRKLADGAEIRIEVDGDQNMTLSSGRSRFNLQCLSADSFPDLKSGEFSSNFVIPASDLLDLIDRTGFATSTEETRYYLNGIHFHTLETSEGGALRAVATDGHRMARTEVAAPDGSMGMPPIIVPKKTVNEIQKLLDGSSDDVRVGVSDTKIRIEFGEVVLLSKLIDGTFPDYDRVTPKNNDKRMVVDRQAFATAVDRVSTIASEKGGKSVKLAANAGLLELSVNNPDHGAASEEMAADFDTDGFGIGFNAKYLLDIVGQIRTSEAEFWFNDSGSPTIIKDNGEGKALYVLMPMRI